MPKRRKKVDDDATQNSSFPWKLSFFVTDKLHFAFFFFLKNRKQQILLETIFDRPDIKVY